MQRTITVKGVGRVSAKPDYVTVAMELSNTERDYDDAMKSAAFALQQITDCLKKVGFDKEDIKTTNFDIRTSYRSEKDKNGNYKSVFEGFEYTHSLKLEFDFDNNLLSKTMVALAGCPSNPEFRIKFTVKDPTAVSDELLREATINARKRLKYCVMPLIQSLDSLLLSIITGEKLILFPILIIICQMIA